MLNVNSMEAVYIRIAIEGEKNIAKYISIDNVACISQAIY